jgi:hypothetical protein
MHNTVDASGDLASTPQPAAAVSFASVFTKIQSRAASWAQVSTTPAFLKKKYWLVGCIGLKTRVLSLCLGCMLCFSRLPDWHIACACDHVYWVILLVLISFVHACMWCCAPRDCLKCNKATMSASRSWSTNVCLTRMIDQHSRGALTRRRLLQVKALLSTLEKVQLKGLPQVCYGRSTCLLVFSCEEQMPLLCVGGSHSASIWCLPHVYPPTCHAMNVTVYCSCCVGSGSVSCLLHSIHTIHTMHIIHTYMPYLLTYNTYHTCNT